MPNSNLIIRMGSPSHFVSCEIEEKKFEILVSGSVLDAGHSAQLWESKGKESFLQIGLPRPFVETLYPVGQVHFPPASGHPEIVSGWIF
jgi:hypothetical protein